MGSYDLQCTDLDAVTYTKAVQSDITIKAVTHDASLGDIGSYLTNNSYIYLNITNLSNGTNGVIYLRSVVTAPASLSITSRNTSGTIVSTKLMDGAISMTANKVTAIYYTYAINGAYSYNYVSYNTEP